MDSIPIEDINLEDELTPEELIFNNEINRMTLELKKMDEQRKNYVETIREKIRDHVKNGDDAIGYLARYLKLSIDFVDYQFEVIDGSKNSLTLFTDDTTVNGCYEIQKLANQLCSAYLKIDIDIDDHFGYVICYSNKDEAETICENIFKNGNDAISNLPKYLEPTIDFVNYQFQEINGRNILLLQTDNANYAGYCKITEIANKLCGSYLNIEVEVDVDDYGYRIYYSNKEGK